MPKDPGEAGLWTKQQRETRGWSAKDLARRVSGLLREAGMDSLVSQQVMSKFEQGDTKRMPLWTGYIVEALRNGDDETREDPYLSMGRTDDVVGIKMLPNFVGMGAGGSDDGDVGVISFSRDLVERELRAPPEALLAMVAEGNSMEPDFEGGDQILVDTRRKALAQPGAFCLWDGDGHVIKYLEKVPDSDPPKVRVVSRNSDLYGPHERLVDEINIIGRVVWFGRRVQ